MANMTAYLETALGKHCLGLEAFTMPSGLYLALFTEDPGRQGALTNELDGGGYERQAVDFQEDGEGVFANFAVVFEDLPGDDVGGIGILDAASAGNMLFHAGFDPVSMDPGQTYFVGADTITIDFD